MNRLIQYIIEAKDATAKGLEAAANRVKRFGQTVRDAVTGMQSATDGQIEERFIHTSNVLDIVGRALDRAGISGESFGDAMDTLERRLNNFNRTGQGAEELIEHFKNSMQDLGLSAKQIDNGVAMLKRNMTDFGTSGKEAAKAVKKDMRDVHLLMGVMHGNVYALTRGFVSLIGRVKQLGISASAIGGITIAIYLAVEAVKKLVGWFKSQYERMEEIKNIRFEDSLKRYADTQNELNKKLEIQLTAIDREVDAKKRLIDHNQKLIEQELELARIRATEGKSGYELESINRDYDMQIAESRARAKLEKAQLDIGAGEASNKLVEEARKQLAAMKEVAANTFPEFEKQVAKMEAAARAKIEKKKIGLQIIGSTNYGYVHAAMRGLTEDEQKQEFEMWQASDEDYRKVKEKRDKLNQSIENMEDALRNLETKAYESAKKIQERQFEIEETQGDFAVKAEREVADATKSYYEELSDIAEDEYKAWLAEQKAARKQEMQDRVSELNDANATAQYWQSAQKDQIEAVRAASAKVNTAWGFYRDNSSLIQHNADMEREISAQKQYGKDLRSLERGSWSDELSTAKRLNRRGDELEMEEMFAKWRKNGLSIEQEATMRVAVAKDEQKLAQKALDEINETMADALNEVQRCANAVDEIAAAIAEGGE